MQEDAKLIRDGVAEHGGVLSSALVLNVRDINETEGKDILTVLVEKDEEFFEGSVQVAESAEGYKPKRGDLIDIHADEADDTDQFCTITPVIDEADEE